MERLQKVIAHAGLTSRRKAEEMIREGRVKVDSKVVLELGYQVGPKQEIRVDDVVLEKEEKVYFLLHKPRGVVTTTQDEKNRKTVIDLIDTDKRIYPVGRLDYDTTGALLLTNDGELANYLMHPSSHIEKVYVAKVKGIVKGDTIVSLKNGVMIDGVKTARARVKLRKVDLKKETSMVEIAIHEGRNHQVKRMFEAVGFEVLKLKRIRIGFFDLTGLKSGEYRPLSKKEVAILHSMMKEGK